MRFILLILNNGECYLHGRIEEVKQFYFCNVDIPIILSESFQNEDKITIPCITHVFDGELVIDKYEIEDELIKEEKIYYEYLIFDTLMSNKISVAHFDYLKRLVYAKDFLLDIENIKNFCKKKYKTNWKVPLNEELYNKPKIKLKLKDFFELNHLDYLLENVINIMPHKNDGVIFTKVSAPYKSFKNENIIKWKPPNQLTIDFLIFPNDNFNRIFDEEFKERVVDLYVLGVDEHKDSEKVLFDYMFVSREFYKELKEEIRKKKLENNGGPVYGIIAECKFDKDIINLPMKKILLSLSDYDDLEEYELIEKVIDYSFFSQIDKKIDLMITIVNYYKDSDFKGNWAFDRWRKDKSNPNYIDTAKNILLTISENIQQKTLINILKENLGGPNPVKKIKT